MLYTVHGSILGIEGANALKAVARREMRGWKNFLSSEKKEVNKEVRSEDGEGGGMKGGT